MTSADASHSLAHQGTPSHAERVGVRRGNLPVDWSEEDIFHEWKRVICVVLHSWKCECVRCWAVPNGVFQLFLRQHTQTLIKTRRFFFALFASDCFHCALHSDVQTSSYCDLELNNLSSFIGIWRKMISQSVRSNPDINWFISILDALWVWRLTPPPGRMLSLQNVDTGKTSVLTTDEWLVPLSALCQII